MQVIPGNETKVAEMLNSLAMQGANVVAGRTDNLHVSGHAYQVRPGFSCLVIIAKWVDAAYRSDLAVMIVVAGCTDNLHVSGHADQGLGCLLGPGLSILLSMQHQSVQAIF